MKLLRGLHEFAELAAGSAVTIGNFDGLHCGHQALLSALKTKAQQLQLPTLVVFFEPQPGEYFQPVAPPARLMTRREKLQGLCQFGIDYAYCFSFNDQLAVMSAKEFACRFIFSLFRASYLLIGRDFRFGLSRSGTPDLLALWGSPMRCQVERCPDFLMNNVRVSSTLIRQSLLQGDLQQAALWLGRPFALTGRVVHGDGRGREWGVPTANLVFVRRDLPLKGVFCVQVQRADQRLYWGVANVGHRPTVGDGTKRLEVHLFNFQDTLYHERLTVNFLHRLRDEKKFASLDALIAQINNDISAAKEFILRRKTLLTN